MKLVKRKYMELVDKSKRLFAGIDLHLRSWHVTIRTEDVELVSVSIPGTWEALQHLLEPYKGCAAITAVYEAGYFGFWLHDRLETFGVRCLVTPPSLIPLEVGNKVKTDRRDSRKLARLLSSGLLKEVWVPSPEELAHRQVVRRRRQLIGDRVRTQNRIKAELRFFGIEIASPRGHWSQRFVENLSRVKPEDHWLAESFHRLLEQYEFLTGQILKQTKLIEELSRTELYKERVALLRTVPGIGLLAAMELLVELQDVSRFRRAEELSAYVGLTPAQYSSGEHVRLGRITCTGKSALRGTLIEVSWRLVARDTLARQKYDELKARSGAKRAVVAIARTTLLRTRRMLLDRVPYDRNAGRTPGRAA